MSDGVCLCVFVWVWVDVRRTQLESRCTSHPPKKFSGATDASLPCCDGRKKRVSIATQESALGGGAVLLPCDKLNCCAA